MPLGPGESDIVPALVPAARAPMRWQTVRQQFDRRAARLTRHGFLLHEVAGRLADRLDYIRLAPRRIVDIGCGAGGSRALLAARFPAAHWIGVDLSLPMLQARETNRGLFGSWIDRIRSRGSARVCGEAAGLPFADGTFDLVFSNLMLHWHPTPHSVFPEWKRVLGVDGLLLFSCFGPDTLQELRAACAEALQESYPMPFIDMHDFGDMMVAAGFATPVMDVETIRLTYPSAHELIAEARALGGNPRDDRGRSIVSGARARALLAALERRRDHAGRIPLTFEVAYGHAWKPAPKSATETVISLDRLRAGLGVRGV
ncbi:MAG TPA: methyltransferase domain-containing protein [Burkholderiaceae bacterium]|jgi:malonyl-CoA O-methyltransferase|nr:methyltransferase domain-containing protein [Burkholderiaceae bacterium]